MVLGGLLVKSLLRQGVKGFERLHLLHDVGCSFGASEASANPAVKKTVFFRVTNGY
jgi:hypothetical protein